MNTKGFTIGIDARLWNETGVGRYIRNLVKHIANLDNSNQYILFLGEHEYDSYTLPGENFQKKLADVHWHTIQEQISFQRIISKENLDLMHFPYFSYPLLYTNPFIITIHDLILHHFATGQASTLPSIFYMSKLFGYKFLLQNGAKRAKKIITVSNATKKEIVDHLHVPSEKIIVTYEGIDTNIHYLQKKQSGSNHQIPEDYFLYVGNAYPHKNVDKLVAAFAKIQSHHTNIKLILVGKKDFFYERLQITCSQLHLTHSVVFYEDVSDQLLAYLYIHAIGLVIPSLMEGFGLPALEAMSLKCLVIASAIPSLQEICKDAAVYFNPNNIDDIAQKLLLVLSKRNDFIPYIERGVDRAEYFSWNKMAGKTIEAYESCIGL